MKEILIALISALGGSLITFTVTYNYFSKKFYEKNVFQKIFSIVNFGNNTYNDEKIIEEIVAEKTKNKPDVFWGTEEPQNLKDGEIYIQIEEE